MRYILRFIKSRILSSFGLFVLKFFIVCFLFLSAAGCFQVLDSALMLDLKAYQGASIVLGSFLLWYLFKFLEYKGIAKPGSDLQRLCFSTAGAFLLVCFAVGLVLFLEKHAKHAFLYGLLVAGISMVGDKSVDWILNMLKALFVFTKSPVKTIKDVKNWVDSEKERDLVRQANTLKAQFEVSEKKKRKVL